MKKIAFFCCALLALGFASCDDKSDLGTIQTNPQEPAVSADAVVPALSAEFAGTTLNLNTVAAQIGGISNPEIENLPAGAEVVYEMQLATKADYSNATILEVENGKVSAEAWNTYYRETLGMNNTPLPNYIRFAAYFVQGTQRYRVGTENTWYGAKQIVVTPKKFEYPVMTVNTPEGNFQLADFAGDGALYTGIGYITSDYTFTFDGKTYGKKTNSTLVEGTTPCTVRNASLYIVEFNPEKLSYKATQVRSLGAIGDFNNWARQSNLTCRVRTSM